MFLSFARRLERAVWRHDGRAPREDGHVPTRGGRDGGRVFQSVHAPRERGVLLAELRVRDETGRALRADLIRQCRDVLIHRRAQRRHFRSRTRGRGDEREDHRTR